MSWTRSKVCCLLQPTATILASRALTVLLRPLPALLATQPGLRSYFRGMNVVALVLSSGDKSTTRCVSSAMRNVWNARPTKMCVLSAVYLNIQSGSAMTVQLSVLLASTARLITLEAIYVRRVSSLAILAHPRPSASLVLRTLLILRNYSRALNVWLPALHRLMCRLEMYVSHVARIARHVATQLPAAIHATQAGSSQITCAMKPTARMDTTQMEATLTVLNVTIAVTPVPVQPLTAHPVLARSSSITTSALRSVPIPSMERIISVMTAQATAQNALLLVSVQSALLHQAGSLIKEHATPPALLTYLSKMAATVSTVIPPATRVSRPLPPAPPVLALRSSSMVSVLTPVLLALRLTVMALHAAPAATSASLVSHLLPTAPNAAVTPSPILERATPPVLTQMRMALLWQASTVSVKNVMLTVRRVRSPPLNAAHVPLAGCSEKTRPARMHPAASLDNTSSMANACSMASVPPTTLRMDSVLVCPSLMRTQYGSLCSSPLWCSSQSHLSPSV